jgi:glutamyl-tRNA synthetase
MSVLWLLCVVQERMHGIDSKCRSRSPEETLTIFKEMQQGTERGLINCLRFKLDMQNPNKALRDPVAFRCNLTPHWRTGEKYKVNLARSP